MASPGEADSTGTGSGPAAAGGRAGTPRSATCHRHVRRPAIAGCLVLLSVAAAGCDGPQSALSPAGRDAAVLADLFRVLAWGAAAIWLALAALFFYATRERRQSGATRRAAVLVVGGGILAPSLVLIVLIGYALSIMPDQRRAGSGLTIRVTGEQWWWRVEYLPEGASEPVIAANEVRLPVGNRTEIVLSADKVIHSFWIPTLAGKMDMFPGRETRMAVEPLRAGIFRGQCAEFCGTSHALMAFQAVAMEPAAFDAWLARERGPAPEPADALAERGQSVFLAEGCGACHTIRGTPATGRIGPDLTRVGSRESLAAGILPNDPAAFARWIRHPAAIKPEVAMPSYDHLSESDLAALAHYLEGLQ